MVNSPQSVPFQPNRKSGITNRPNTIRKNGIFRENDTPVSLCNSKLLTRITCFTIAKLQLRQQISLDYLLDNHLTLSPFPRCWCPRYHYFQRFTHWTAKLKTLGKQNYNSEKWTWNQNQTNWNPRIYRSNIQTLRLEVLFEEIFHWAGSE